MFAAILRRGTAWSSDVLAKAVASEDPPCLKVVGCPSDDAVKVGQHARPRDGQLVRSRADHLASSDHLAF